MPWKEHTEPGHEGTYYFEPDPEEAALDQAELTEAEQEVAAMPGKTIVIEPDTPAESTAEPTQRPAQTTRRRRRGARR